MFKKFYLKGFEKEVLTACEMSGIDPEDAEDLLDSYFKALDYLIDDDRAPTITIEGLGKLSFDPLKVKRILKERGTYPLKEENKKRYELQLDLLSKRIEKEKNKEKGVGFWWSFVPKNFLTTLINKDEKQEGGV